MAFYDCTQGNTTLLHTVTTPPYNYIWNNPAAGIYTLTAKATDSYGMVGSSSPVNVTVNDVPVCSMTAPANNNVYIAPSSITLSVSVGTKKVGTISSVAFYDCTQGNTTLLHTVTSSPYNYTWTNPASGMHILTAKATDSYGAVGSSIPVNITIWATGDINASNGSASYSSGTFTVAGRGTGITGTSDGFRFVYLPMNSNCTVTARVTAVSGTLSSNSRSGVMVRATTASGSQELSSLYKPYSTKQYYLHYRTSTNGSTSTSYVTANTSSPWWVRVVMSGSTFKAYESANGTTWTQVGSSQTISMSNPVQVGLV